MKLIRAFYASVFFLASLCFIYFIHISHLKVNVVFYAAIADGFVASIIALAILVLLPYFRIFNHFEKLLLALIWMLIGYSLAISIPTVIDRSLSFYILEKLQQRGGGIKLDRFEEVFTEEYMREYRLVDVRLTEQKESGTIVIEDGCVKLTDRGDSIATMSRRFRQKLLPKERLLMGEYSDTLTDPFRNSVLTPSYLCN